MRRFQVPSLVQDAEKNGLQNILGIRLGGNYTELSSGFSARLEKLNLNLKLDYAFLWPILIDDTLGTHRVSLTYQF